MEPEGSLLCSQELSTGPYCEPALDFWTEDGKTNHSELNDSRHASNLVSP
jgi:hypothetical protein